MFCEGLSPGSAVYPGWSLSLARPDPAHSSALKMAASAGLGTAVPRVLEPRALGAPGAAVYRALPWHSLTPLLCPHVFPAIPSSTHGCLSSSGRSSTGSQ